MDLEEAERRLRGGADDGKKLWQAFPGKNRICCRGFCLTGPDAVVFIFNHFLTFGILALFYALVAIRLHIGVIVGGFILHGISLYFLLRCAFTEPGILPRSSQAANKDIIGDPPKHIVNGREVQLAYCSTCHIFRPPKTKHCRICDNCVEEFDHHCPWVMNCVAKRNYRYFVGFVAAISSLCVYVCVCSLVLLIISAVEGNQLPTPVVLISIIIVLVTGCLGCTLSGFAIFHCRLIAQGITTNEYIKGRQTDIDDKGCVMNCCNIYCTELPKPRIDLQGPAVQIEMREEGKDPVNRVSAEAGAEDPANAGRPSIELGHAGAPDEDIDEQETQ
mmetsp:Transcript_7781/g.19066  ORF Transcript_7781/g.19066 Transcript_7781/m.19066 type:complete len:332 (-) Transcript_7781:1619-2614(-)